MSDQNYLVLYVDSTEEWTFFCPYFFFCFFFIFSIFSLFFLFVCLFVCLFFLFVTFFFLFRITFIRICYLCNVNLLYFLDEESLVLVTWSKWLRSNELFQKKSKQAAEGVKNIDFPGVLKKEHVEIPVVN